MSHKAGFVNIIGNPNVGKSTLMNALVGEKLSVITNKAQTTRRRILGMLNTEDYQVVFSDTPGILDPKYALQQSMMNEVESALEDADVFLLVTEIPETFNHPDVIGKIEKSGVPVFILLNKIDLSDQETVMKKIEEWKERIPAAGIIPISALHGFNTEAVITGILEKLPEHPPYFDKEDLTDKPERYLVSEMIRGCALELYKKEVPYSVEVVVDSFVQEEELLRIRAIIYVTRESQKVILIGEGGKAIKRLGIMSRKELETFFGIHVFLELFVKVSKDWRDDKLQLKRFGYQI
ncbi:MAG: GTPase Era [Bacteroidetes bacterium]|nr:GTPase Era [Bacteroidota bacterium]